jgi:hypothetical protein
MADTYTWDGNGGNSGSQLNWSTSNNWAPNGAPASGSGHDLIFATSNKLNATADGGSWTLNSLTFNSTAGAFSLSGSGLNIGTGGIVNNSTSTQTIANQVTASADQSWNASAGSIIFNGYVGGNGKTIGLAGSNNITFNNQLNGAGTINLTGSGNRTFNDYVSASALNAGGTGTSTYNGQVQVSTVTVTDGTQLFNGSMNVSSLYINGGTTTLTGSGNKNIANTYVSGGTLIMAQTGGGDAINGNLTIYDGGTVVMTGDNQIPTWTSVTLNEGSTLLLNDTTQTFNQLIINGDSVIDFGTGGSELSLSSYANGVVVADGVTLTIQNWNSTGDVFSGSNPGTNVVNIQYADSNGDIYATATWGGSGGGSSTITPVPEPAAYGLLLMGAGLAFHCGRRRHRLRSPA